MQNVHTSATSFPPAMHGIDAHRASTLGAAAFKSPASPIISVTGAQQNNLLKALSRTDLESLFGDLELVALPAGKRLFDLGGLYEYTYFPTNSIISLMYINDDGASTEIAVVGHEGVVGVALYDGERASCCAIVQTAGYAYRLKTSVLRAAFKQGGPLAQLMFRYTSALLTQIAQNVVASHHCSIEQKLARWLLERLDRSTSSEMKITQDSMASMLGVRRESVTVAASKLQDAGLIQYHRGTVEVLDRSGLERHAGTCYQAAKAGFAQFLGLSASAM